MYSLVLMDFKMPNCNGCEATAMIKKTLRDLNEEVPFVACVTNFNNNATMKAVMGSGADLFMCKPIFKNGIHKLLLTAKIIKNQDNVV